jgi:hypothetical protein
MKHEIIYNKDSLNEINENFQKAIEFHEKFIEGEGFGDDSDEDAELHLQKFASEFASIISDKAREIFVPSDIYGSREAGKGAALFMLEFFAFKLITEVLQEEDWEKGLAQVSKGIDQYLQQKKDDNQFYNQGKKHENN